MFGNALIAAHICYIQVLERKVLAYRLYLAGSVLATLLV